MDDCGCGSCELCLAIAISLSSGSSSGSSSSSSSSSSSDSSCSLSINSNNWFFELPKYYNLESIIKFNKPRNLLLHLLKLNGKTGTDIKLIYDFTQFFSKQKEKSKDINRILKYDPSKKLNVSDLRTLICDYYADYENTNFDKNEIIPVIEHDNHSTIMEFNKLYCDYLKTSALITKFILIMENVIYWCFNSKGFNYMFFHYE